MDPTRRSLTEDRTKADYIFRILSFLIQAEGISRIFRFFQYALENEAAEILLPQYGEQIDKAAKIMKIVEDLEPIYLKTKDEYKL
jgi:hypothetical protein